MVMQKAISFIIVFAEILSVSTSFSQLVSKDITMTYKVVAYDLDKGDSGFMNIDGALYTVKVKDNQTRTDFVNSLGEESVIYDRQNNKGVILKAYGSQHLMYRLNQEQWSNFISRLYYIKFEIDNEKTTQNGYLCEHAIAKEKNGASIEVYFHPDVIPVNDQYGLSFQQLKGLPVRVIKKSGNQYFEYSLTNIGFEPISSNVFSEPKSGYRILEYKEAKAIKQ